MDEITVNLITAVCSLALGGVASSYVTHRMGQNKERLAEMRRNAEKLYLAADEFGRQLDVYLIRHLPVAKGKMNYNQMLDQQIADPPMKEAGGAEMMTMLIRIYFPALEPELDGLFRARDHLSEVSGAHKQDWREGGGIGQEWVDAFTSAGREITAASNALKTSIIEAGRRYADEPRLFGLRRKTPAHVRTA
ncbi:MAG: hypothetical protein Q8L66_02105 [Caulobacter sp.]|nr:hypothetical protein [Caulobacter sp.]